ncbi:MAG: outer membrane beta-barrel protein [Flavisolibacter sp.]|nr:outer membrane beta-barrel protein [Flavisolibacter sp.]
MRKFSFLALLLTCSVFAQSQVQIGLFGGISNYVGDMTDKPYTNSKGAFGVTVGYQILSRVNLRAGFTFAKVSGADSLAKKEDVRLRNLSFQSNISEFSAVAEINTFNMDYKIWSPYIFGGLAVFHFDPYTYDQQNNKVYLKPLGTEGQGISGYQKPYALTQLALPFGGGIKYNVSDKVRIALEVGLRKLFTDYLDDVSGNYADPNDLLTYRGQQSVDLSYREDELPFGDPFYPPKGETRGSPKYKDYYYFTGLHLVYTLGGDGSSALRGGRNKRYGCPTVF